MYTVIYNLTGREQAVFDLLMADKTYGDIRSAMQMTQRQIHPLLHAIRVKGGKAGQQLAKPRHLRKFPKLREYDPMDDPFFN